jgi:16S rRNA (cytosine967-C5)-methyltransferase
MRESARTIALDLHIAVEFDGAYANLLLPKLLSASRLDQRDLSLAQELAFGTLRWQLFYDCIIELCAKRNTSDIDARTLLVLRLGAHQLLGMRIPAHAALDETVELAKQKVSRGSAGFVNGVLRRISEKSRQNWLEEVLQQNEDVEMRLAIEFSHPVWIVKALGQALKLDGRGDDLRDLLLADNIAPLVSLVALPGLAFEEDFEDLPIGPSSPIGALLDSGDPNNLKAFREGRVRVQDQGSQLVTLALLAATELDKNEKWLDLCAGPGGKAVLLAAEAKMHSAQLVCNEISVHRAKLVRQALSPVNTSTPVEVHDGRDLPSHHQAAYDRILLDAPCTGLGALRRRPEARWRKKISDVSELTRLQEQLLESAWTYLKPGGVIAYVTCSPHVAETNAIVDWALKRLPAVELIDSNKVLKTINPNLALNTTRATSQLWPHLHQTDAMFLALLRKSVG